jgi:hypothetical protein
MKRSHTYQIIVFLLLFIGIDQILGRSIAHFASKYKFDKRIGLLVDNKLDKDVLVLGSSRALNGIDPETIQNESKLSCYNLAMSGSNIVFHETMLDLVILSENHPKKIIYCIDDPGTLMDLDEKVIYRKEELYPYVYNDAVNKIVAKRLDKSVWLTKFSPTYHHNVNFITAIKYLTRGPEKPTYDINNVDINGANLLEGNQAGKDSIRFKGPLYTFDKEHVEYAKSFSSIISKCKKNNIELILVFPPLFFSPTIGLKERIIDLANNECVILDYSDILRDDDLFYNQGHLNKAGAIKISRLIATHLIENK